MKLREAFHLRNPAGHRHLWVVIYAQDDQFILVNFTTKRSHSDNTCVIKPGEHPFVKQDTVVYYQRLKLLNKWDARLVDSNGKSKSYPDISEELLKRIQEGAIKSRFTPQGAKKLIKTRD